MRAQSHAILTRWPVLAKLCLQQPAPYGVEYAVAAEAAHPVCCANVLKRLPAFALLQVKHRKAEPKALQRIERLETQYVYRAVEGEQLAFPVEAHRGIDPGQLIGDAEALCGSEKVMVAAKAMVVIVLDEGIPYLPCGYLASKL